jgi:hypothetical protein
VSASRTGRFTFGERTCDTHWTRGWVGPTADLDIVEKRTFLTSAGIELRFLGHPAHGLVAIRIELSRLQESVPAGNNDVLAELRLNIIYSDLRKRMQQMRII